MKVSCVLVHARCSASHKSGAYTFLHVITTFLQTLQFFYKFSILTSFGARSLLRHKLSFGLCELMHPPPPKPGPPAPHPAYPPPSPPPHPPPGPIYPPPGPPPTLFFRDKEEDPAAPSVSLSNYNYQGVDSLNRAIQQQFSSAP